MINDKLMGALIGLARATEGNEHMISSSTNKTAAAALAAMAGECSLSGSNITSLIETVEEEKRKIVPNCYYCASPCGRTEAYDMENLWKAHGEIRERKVRLMTALCNLAANSSADDIDKNSDLIYRALYYLGEGDWCMEELVKIATEVEKSLKLYAEKDACQQK